VVTPPFLRNVGISSRVFFLHSYRAFACRHELLLRVHVPAYSNADQGAEDAVEWADDDHEPLFEPGLRTLDVWVAQNSRYLRLASAEGVIGGSERHNVYLLTDEDGRGDLSAR